MSERFKGRRWGKVYIKEKYQKKKKRKIPLFCRNYCLGLGAVYVHKLQNLYLEPGREIIRATSWVSRNQQEKKATHHKTECSVNVNKVCWEHNQGCAVIYVQGL